MNNLGAFSLILYEGAFELFGFRGEGGALAQARVRLGELGDREVTVVLYSEPSCPARHKWLVVGQWSGPASELKEQI